TAIVGTGVTNTSLSWTGVSNAIAGKLYMRLRVMSQSLTDNAATATIDERSIGNASNGEVEDYQLSTTFQVNGSIYNDANGLSNSIIDGALTDAGGSLKAVLYDNTTGQVANFVAVAAGGTYSFTAYSSDTYTVYLTTASVSVGQTAIPTVTL